MTAVFALMRFDYPYSPIVVTAFLFKFEYFYHLNSGFFWMPSFFMNDL